LLLESTVTSLVGEPTPGLLDDISSAGFSSGFAKCAYNPAGSKQAIHRMPTPLISNRAQGIARKDGTVKTSGGKLE
jgi:hypothetical protein